MSSHSGTSADDQEGVFKYRKKILKMKLLFASGVGTICLLAGFKYGYSKSKVKHGSSEFIKDKTLEDPVKFAGRALKRATFITVGCFVVGISVVSIGFGIHSFTDLRNISRRKWLNQNNGSESQRQVDELDGNSDSNQLTGIHFDQASIAENLDNEIIVDKAEQLDDKWK